MKNVLIYSDELSRVEYTSSHPFKPVRAKQLMDLLDRYSLIFEEDQEIVKHEPLEEELLYLYHTHEYIEALKNCDKGDFDPVLFQYGLGTHDNPIFPGVYEYSLLAAGGTVQGARLLLGGDTRFVFNPNGGLHHAMSDHAEGFCYVNDIVIAIRELLNHGMRVAYIDIDVHHGDGVQDAFYEENRVLTVSMHESGHTLFPGGGFENEMGKGDGLGYTLNVPLLEHSDDEVFVHAYEHIVGPRVERFKPDIVCIQIGGDAHREDPLGHLNITSNGYSRVLSSINDKSDRILATGGGGYNMFKTAALWALAWATFCGIEPRDQFAGAVGGMMYGPEAQAGSLYDEPYHVGGYRKEQCMKHVDDVERYITMMEKQNRDKSA